MKNQYLRANSVSGLAIGVALCGLAMPETVQAQDESPQAAEDSDAGVIVVTARRKEENIQDVPISIGMLNNEEIEARQIVTFQDIKSAVPNVATVATSTPGGGYFMMRGLTAIATPDVVIDSQIGLYVDGVYLGRAQMSGGNLTDIARLEAYRGPQGTLFGKNSTGGAINFITAAPTGEFGLDGTLSVGNFNRRYAKMTLNTPEFSGLSARLTYQHEEFDGDQKNAYDGPGHTLSGYNGGSRPVASFGKGPVAKDFGSRNSDTILAKVRYTGIDGVTVDYKYDWTDTVITPVAIQGFGWGLGEFAAGAAGLYLGSPAGSVPLSFKRLGTISQNGASETSLKAKGHLLNIAVDIDDNTTVKSISAYRTSSSGGVVDLDSGAHVLQGLEFIGYHSYVNWRQKQWSQELQVIGEYKDFDYILGGFYFKEKAAQDQAQVAFTPIIPGPDGLVPVPPEYVTQMDGTNNKAYAVYGSVNVRPVENLEASLGARYTWDRKKTTDFRGLVPVVGTFRDDRLTWDASLTYSVTPDINIYARYAKGYNAGGVASTGSFGAEKTQSYEAGVKSELFDRKLRLNVSAFHMKSTDLQTAFFIGGVGSVYSNVGTFKVDGIEVEAFAQPIDGLTLSANYGYVDPKYSDGRWQTTPNENLSVSATYDTPPVLGGEAYLSIRVDADYRSKYYASNLNSPATRSYFAAADFLPPAIWAGYPSAEDYFNTLIKSLDAGDYWIANARVSLMNITGPSGTFSITGYVKNIFDNEGLIFPINYGAIMGSTFERPRTYGVEIGFSF